MGSSAADRGRRIAASGWTAALVATLTMGGVVGAGCMDPEDRRPGLRLTGEVVEGAVEDWSFSDAHPEIFLEVRTPWWIPHSVTIVATALEGDLYVHARNPEQKRWVGLVGRDPRVRLEIDAKIYERRLERIDDPELEEAIRRDFAAKYGWGPEPPEERPPRRYFRVVPRAEG